MLGRLFAILTLSRRTDCLTGAAKVIDGDTIVVGEHGQADGIDAPELDQTFWWRGPACGTILEALTVSKQEAAVHDLLIAYVRVEDLDPILSD